MHTTTESGVFPITHATPTRLVLLFMSAAQHARIHAQHVDGETRERIEGLAAELHEESTLGDAPDPWRVMAAFGVRAFAMNAATDDGEHVLTVGRTGEDYDVELSRRIGPRQQAELAVLGTSYLVLLGARIVGAPRTEAEIAHACDCAELLCRALLVPEAPARAALRAGRSLTEAFPAVSPKLARARLRDLRSTSLRSRTRQLAAVGGR